MQHHSHGTTDADRRPGGRGNAPGPYGDRRRTALGLHVRHALAERRRRETDQFSARGAAQVLRDVR